MRNLNFGLTLLLGVLLIACDGNDDGNQPKLPPQVTTGIYTISSDGTVSLSGYYTRNENTIIEYGIEFGTSDNLIDDVATLYSDVDSIDTDFTFEIGSGLQKGTMYYYRAYAKSDNSYYGVIKNFEFDGYAPRVESISNSNIQIGDTLEIKGKYFFEEKLPAVVRISNIESPIISANDSILTCIVPPILISIDNTLQVFVGQKASEIVDFQLTTPVITSLDPLTGFDGTEARITGNHFSKNINFNRVLVNDIEATIKSSSDSQILFTIPEMEFFGAATIKIAVGFQIIQSEQTFDLKGPEVQSISTNAAYSGSTLTVSGVNFTQNGELTQVFFDGFQSEILEVDSVKITLKVPFSNFENALVDQVRNMTIVNGLKTSVGIPFTILNSWNVELNITSQLAYIGSLVESAFVINDKAYFLHPYTSATYDMNLFEFDPASQTFTEFDSYYPGHWGHENQIFITAGDRVFKIGGHLDGVNEFWEFNYANKNWSQHDDIPFNFQKATTFNVNSNAIIVTDKGEVWSLENTTFSRIHDFPVASKDLFSFKSGNDQFVVTNGQTWLYNPVDDTWIEKSTNPFYYKQYYEYSSFEYDDTGYVLYRGPSYGILSRYNAELDTWEETDGFPACNFDTDKIPFSIGNKAFILSYNHSGCANNDPYIYSYFQE